MIDIEDSPFNWTRSYGGEYTDLKGKDYCFTIITTETEQTAEEIREVTWVDDIPEGDIAILQDVIDTWTEQHFVHFKR